MSKLQIALFTGGTREIDKAIRAFSPGWEHAGILQADGQLWEALVEEGCQLSPGLYTHHAAPEVVTLLDPRLTPDQEDAVLAFLRQTRGAPYDLRGIMGVPLWADWAKAGEYFCSKWVAAALAAAHAFPLNATPSKIWPCHLAWLAPAVWPLVQTIALKPPMNADERG